MRYSTRSSSKKQTQLQFIQKQKLMPQQTTGQRHRLKQGRRDKACKNTQCSNEKETETHYGQRLGRKSQTPIMKTTVNMMWSRRSRPEQRKNTQTDQK